MLVIKTMPKSKVKAEPTNAARVKRFRKKLLTTMRRVERLDTESAQLAYQHGIDINYRVYHLLDAASTALDCAELELRKLGE